MALVRYLVSALTLVIFLAQMFLVYVGDVQTIHTTLCYWTPCPNQSNELVHSCNFLNINRLSENVFVFPGNDTKRHDLLTRSWRVAAIVFMVQLHRKSVSILMVSGLELRKNMDIRLSYMTW